LKKLEKYTLRALTFVSLKGKFLLHESVCLLMPPPHKGFNCLPKLLSIRWIKVVKEFLFSVAKLR